ncbi:ParB/RepB/Spo0J family partition protein [Patescibacteria group bacterium]|nr:ParB/RepB/Spo0J family partition protein [Patescibacteria group bacterium]
MAEQVVQLDIESLQSNPLQPRGAITTESLAELVDSIKTHGVLEPLVVAKTPAGYQIIAGERRWRASRLVGLKTVPSVVKETTPRGMLEMAIVENIQREDLNPIDRGKSFLRLTEEFGLTVDEVAARISKSKSYVSNTVKLLELPDALKDGLLSGLISEGHARALTSIKDHRTMLEAYKIILRESGSVRRAEELSRRMREKKVKSDDGEVVSTESLISADYDEVAKDIRDFFDKESNIDVKIIRTTVQTRLVISLKGNFEKTEENFKKLHNFFKGKKA